MERTVGMIFGAMCIATGITMLLYVIIVNTTLYEDWQQERAEAAYAAEATDHECHPALNGVCEEICECDGHGCNHPDYQYGIEVITAMRHECTNLNHRNDYDGAWIYCCPCGNEQ